MSRNDTQPAKNMRAFWNRVHLTNLYRGVLDKGYKIRVYEKRPDGVYILETYTERGWWIFKTKDHQRVFILHPEEGTISQTTIRPG